MSPSFEPRSRVLVVGGVGGTNVGESLRRAGAALGRDVVLMNAAGAMSTSRLLQRAAWHLAGRRPLHLAAYARQVVDLAAHNDFGNLIATGPAPLTAGALRRLRSHGVRSINFSTDDPWNRAHRAPWHIAALPHYDIVFSPRRSNIADFQALGCADVRYLPFGYDDHLFTPPAGLEVADVTAHDILFVGGADRDRAEFFEVFARNGPRPTLAGSYWERFAATRSFTLGQKSAHELRDLTARSSINLCLVRRANRDGHVMRSFEIPACGGFMIAEDTEEHRSIFGPEGKCVLYFSGPDDAAAKATRALADPAARQRLAAAALHRIRNGQHTYRDRLRQMLEANPV